MLTRKWLLSLTKPESILLNTVQCIVESIIAGLIAAFVLLLAVMLLSNYSSATPVEDTRENIARETGTIKITDPAEVRQGTLLFRGKEDFSVAPLLKTEVQIDVTGMIVRARLKQSFRNPDEHWKEGIYVFPLPEDAAVDRLRMHIGERVIEGQIKEREEARHQYETARTEGKRASLVEQERSNIFTTSVANIGPQEEIVVEIEYQHLARYDAGAFHLRFPMVVGPRYIPGNIIVEGFQGSGWAVNTDQVADAARITPPVLHPDQGPINPVEIKINLDAGFPLQQVASSYHNIEIKPESNTRYAIKLEHGPVAADRDFELSWQPEPAQQPRAAFFNEEKNQQHYGLIMLLPPEQIQGPQLTREVIYVIDTSGSMAGTSIVQARAALELALAELKPGDRFNIIQFNSVTSRLFTHPQAVTEKSMAEANHYVQQLQAEGGTEMLPALQAALAQSSDASAVRQVIFLTDGSIGNEEELFRVIEQKLGNSRLFTVGIGSAPNSYFMSRAASYGRGTYTYIGKVEEVQEKMAALFQKLASPVLSDVQVNWSDAQAIEAWPQKIPDLYRGEPLLISFSAAALPKAMQITGRVSGKDWNSSLKLESGRNETGISVLWARKKIEALMDQYHSQSEKDQIKRLITETALAHHLVSKFTSLIAVDVTLARVREELLKSQALPVNLPAGWEYEKVFGRLPQTATNAELHLLYGMMLLLAGLLLGLGRKYVTQV